MEIPISNDQSLRSGISLSGIRLVEDDGKGARINNELDGLNTTYQEYTLSQFIKEEKKIRN